jgi:hypothetical protein
MCCPTLTLLRTTKFQSQQEIPFWSHIELRLCVAPSRNTKPAQAGNGYSKDITPAAFDLVKDV